jgi:predicted RNA-binding protein with PIN domain
MAYILIDGYNLIGIAHDNLERARNDLIHNLQEYASRKKHSITVIFDGWKDGRNDQTRITTRHVTTIYSRIGENADTVIKRMIEGSSRHWIVISSDREISDFAVRKDFAALSSEEFEGKLYSAINSAHDRDMIDNELSEEDITKYHEDEFESPSARAKGNPRKLSKKDRKRLQALKKL